MLKKSLLLLISISSLFFSCSNSTLEPNYDRLGFQFFPLGKQNFTYQVEEIYYRNTGEVDTLRYLLIDQLIDSSKVDNKIILSGYRIKQDLNGAETVISTVSYSIDNYTVRQGLGNTEEVKLSFPVEEGLEWNGKPKASEPDIFSLFKVFQPYELDDSIYNQTLQVIQEDNQDSIEVFDKRVEVYAADLGMVYKLSSYLDFCTNVDCFGLQEIDSGRTIQMRRVLP